MWERAPQGPTNRTEGPAGPGNVSKAPQGPKKCKNGSAGPENPRKSPAGPGEIANLGVFEVGFQARTMCQSILFTLSIVFVFINFQKNPGIQKSFPKIFLPELFSVYHMNQDPRE